MVGVVPKRVREGTVVLDSVIINHGVGEGNTSISKHITSLNIALHLFNDNVQHLEKHRRMSL